MYDVLPDSVDLYVLLLAFVVKDGSRTKGGVKQLYIKGIQMGEGGGDLPRKIREGQIETGEVQ